MPSPLIWRAIWAAVAVVFLAALTVAALPYVASTRIVRDRIAWEMSAWSGFRVAIQGTPQIQVWPKFSAVLTDVTLSKWTEAQEPPVIEAERVEIDLSALAALRGDVVFSTVRLIRPTIRTEPTAGGLLLPAIPTGGRIARAVDAARAVVQANPANPDTGKLPSDEFGSVEFRDGRVVTRVKDADAEVITSLTGQASWSALNDAASLQASGIWRGESVAVDLSSAKPLLLLAGGTAPVTASLKAAPANFSFTGNAGLAQNAFVDGQMKFSAPSLRRVLEWTGAGIAPGTAVGAVSVSSKFSAGSGRMKLDNSEIALDKNSGMGVLDISFAEALPVVSGTLAFDTLDLRAFLSAFTPLASVKQVPDDIDNGFADRLNLDLRLSAAHATAGAIQLADVAATVQIKNGLSVFDISDATAFGGNIQTGLRFDRRPEGTQVEMKLLASDINGAAFADAAGMKRLVPTGTGTVSLILKGPGKAWDTILENADGSFTANFGSGNLNGFNLTDFLKHNEQGGFFPLDEVTDGNLPIDGAELKATISRGVARLDKAEVRAGKTKLWLAGIVPYAGRGLALSGDVVQSSPQPAPAAPAASGQQPAPAATPANGQPPAPEPQQPGQAPNAPAPGQNGQQPAPQAAAPAPAPAPSPAPAQKETSFFVGGTWSTPFISPINRRPYAE
ncbi:AsmA family protein [Mesorhizobium sp. SP-1A]|uniref:AsmA family protein n=1 Tax=Mesorhizobium sp. SP-1A TaxID=3077840 RepID=UPI0028F6D87B|nr:AsmA family protein [Mesorhizobium sp. SP-1A]